MRARACAPSWRSEISGSIEPPRATANALLVLGAGVLKSGEPSPPLRRRILAAIDVYRTLDDCLLVCCGGVGRYGPSEASVMERFARDAGIAGDRILLEDRSRTTRQNIRNALALLGDADIGELHILSDATHIPRVRLYTALSGIPARFHRVPQARIDDQMARRSFARIYETAALGKYVAAGVLDRFRSS
jgi:uncharacterized SAM-binding protein YcdF (DUF218 family)